MRHAQLISLLSFVSSLAAQGKGLKKPIPLSDLLPDYFGERKVKVTDPLQRNEYRLFKEKLRAVSPQKVNQDVV